MAFNQSQDNPTSPNPNGDHEVNPQAGDTISQLVWSPVANHLVATSWDKQVRPRVLSSPARHQPRPPLPPFALSLLALASLRPQCE